MTDAETKALIKARAKDFLDIHKWDVIATCAHYGITPTQLYHAATIAQGKIKAGIYDKTAYRNLGILNSLSIGYSLVQNIIGRDLPVKYTEVIKALQEKGRLEIKPHGTLLNRKAGKRVSFGRRYLPPLHDMETAYHDTQIKADIIAQKDFSPRAKKYIAKICAMRKKENPAEKTQPQRNSEMTLDKEDEALIRSIVIPPHNELLKKISDLEAEVKTPRAQLADKSEPAPAIPPAHPAAVETPAVRKTQSRLPPDEENPYASSKVLPRLREFWQKQYITAEEANRIEGILSGVPGKMTDPKGHVTRYEAFEHKRERHILSGWVLAEIKSRGLVLSEREWRFVLSLYHDSAQ